MTLARACMLTVLSDVHQATLNEKIIPEQRFTLLNHAEQLLQEKGRRRRRLWSRKLQRRC
jgi:hypothetical protein